MDIPFFLVLIYRQNAISNSFSDKDQGHALLKFQDRVNLQNSSVSFNLANLCHGEHVGPAWAAGSAWHH